MDAAVDDLTHLLGDDPGHGVHRLKYHAQTEAKIRNLNPVSGAKQNHHRFANDTAEAKEDCCHDAGERRRDCNVNDGLQPRRAKGQRCLTKSARHIVNGILG